MTEITIKPDVIFEKNRNKIEQIIELRNIIYDEYKPSINCDDAMIITIKILDKEVETK